MPRGPEEDAVPPGAPDDREPPDMGVGNSDPLEKQNVFLIT